MPPPPQVCPAGQLGHVMMLPQPSPACPHWMPCCAQVIGVQLDVGGAVETHDARSKSMNASTFSCVVSGLLLHSAGNTRLSVFDPVVT